MQKVSSLQLWHSFSLFQHIHGVLAGPLFLDYSLVDQIAKHPDGRGLRYAEGFLNEAPRFGTAFKKIS